MIHSLSHLCSGLAFSLLPALAAGADIAKPDIIVIFTHHMGCADLACQGRLKDLKTPHLTGAGATPPHGQLCWRFWNQTAIRKGKWKHLQAGPQC